MTQRCSATEVIFAPSSRILSAKKTPRPFATLEKVNLHDIFARVGDDLGKVVDRANVLARGEQHCVAFASLFLKKSAIAFLNELTSTLDKENERFLYERLRASGIAFVSVGHRSTLKAFSTTTLMILKQDGTSELVPIPKPA